MVNKHINWEVHTCKHHATCSCTASCSKSVYMNYELQKYMPEIREYQGIIWMVDTNERQHAITIKNGRKRVWEKKWHSSGSEVFLFNLSLIRPTSSETVKTGSGCIQCYNLKKCVCAFNTTIIMLLNKISIGFSTHIHQGKKQNTSPSWWVCFETIYVQISNQ